MKAPEIITKAKIRLILQQPFFATPALKMTYVPDPSVGTAACDGRKIRYAPAFIETLNVDQCAGLIAHEVSHPLLLHHLRMTGKEKQLWNKAADYAINPLLVDSGFKLPDGGCIDPRFTNLCAEDIYNTLLKERQQQESEQQKQQQESDPGDDQSDEQEDAPGDDDQKDDQKDDDKDDDQEPENDESDDSGDDDQQEEENESEGSENGSEEAEEEEDQVDPDSPEGWGQVEEPEDSTDDLEELEAEAKQMLVQALNSAKMAGIGYSPALERLVKEILEPKIPWREILERFIAEVAHNDYTWTKPSPRYLASGLYLPKLENTEVGKVVFAIDTSISVDEHILDIFSAEMKEASSIFNFPVTVIHCDDEVRHVEELEPESDIHPVGRGCTDFRPPFEYTDENLPDTKALVYLTDGYCSDFPAVEPDYPVLWVIYNNKRFKPPFGEVVYID